MSIGRLPSETVTDFSTGARCGVLGHGSRQCTEEKEEREAPTISCANCAGTGHYARDCKEPRKSGKKGCRNCGEEGHISKDCDKPRSAENVECKNCSKSLSHPLRVVATYADNV